MTWARTRHGDWTVDQLVAYRVQLLEKHDCKETLANIRAQRQGPR